MTFIVEEFISLNSKSTDFTSGPPELYVISHALVLLSIPSFKAVIGLYPNTPGLKDGALNCDVAEYSLSSYLYLYAKQTNLFSKKFSWLEFDIEFIVGDVIGGFLITRRDSAETPSTLALGLG